MKKIYYSTLLTLLFCSQLSLAKKARNEDDNDPKWLEFGKKSAISIGTSAPIGGLIGYLNALYLNRYQDPGTFRIVLSWFIAATTNSEVTKHIEEMLSENKIPHKQALMHASSWITSWLVYLKTRA